MKNKIKKTKEKTIAFSELIILFFGFFAFTYIFSDNLGFVNAEEGIDPHEKIADTSIPVSSTPIPSEVTTGIIAAGATVGTIGVIAAGGAILKGTKYATATKALSAAWGAWLGPFITTAAIAAGLYFLGGFGASLIWPDNPELESQLGAAVTGGFVGGQILGWIFHESFLGGGIGAGALGIASPLISVGGLIGIGVGIVVFLLTAKEEKIVSVAYNCQEWQQPLGGKDCEKCNTGKFPCNDYKCKSLGTGCELVNEESKEYSKCVFVSPSDSTAPIIKPWDGALNKDYSYVDKTANGVSVKYTGEGADEKGCIPYYTMFKYGVNLNEEAKCRYDTQDKNYSEMSNIASKGLGGDYYLKNHSMLTYYTSFNVSNETGTEFADGGYFNTYVRCQDKAGNTDTTSFVFKYCVQTKPDRDSPMIVQEALDPLNGYPIPKDQTSRNVSVYLNKPSSCKWSVYDKDISLMENDMNCNYKTPLTINGKIVFKCIANLTGLQNEVVNTFYFNCKSYPENEEKDRFVMTTNYKYTLQGTKELVIQDVSPLNNTIIKGNTLNMNVTLGATTILGYEDGKANCYYKKTDSSETSYVPFLNTGGTTHSQVIWLSEGNYSYDIRCSDLAGNYDEKTVVFNVESDTSSPKIIRMYNEDGKLKITTNENASCVYSTTDCNYEFEDGNPLTTTNSKYHYLDYSLTGNQNSYYIKCKDSYGNKPSASQCSIIVKPISI